MSWDAQMQEMVGTWTDMQQKMWDSWLQTVRGFGQGDEHAGQWHEEYQRNLESWEQAVRQALEAQSEWTQRWVADVEQEADTPEPVTEWVQQVQAMIKGWNEAQGQLWHAWFDTVRHLDPSQVPHAWDSEGQAVMEAWREATERAQDALKEWSNMAEKLGKQSRK